VANGPVNSVSVRNEPWDAAGPPARAPSELGAEQETEASLSGQPLRVSRSARFQLEYDLDQTQPVGVAGVELWYTDSGGRDWIPYGEDEDRTSPMLVELDREGTYGFRLVLKSADGLTGRPPRGGDPADLWVHADWTPPTARLTSARYGTGEQLGKLLITWEASDRHLAQRAISLFYGRDPNGPWTSIASGLSHTGQYAWQVDDRVPRDFYLRLEVRDRAGNVTVDQLGEPISSDGLAPQGRIRSLRPVAAPRPREAASGANPQPRA
jgi:hypothetical protein